MLSLSSPHGLPATPDGIPSLKGFLPLVPQATDFDKVRLQATLADLPRIKPLYPNKFDAGAFDLVWKKHFLNALEGKVTVVEFLRQVETEVNAILEQVLI